MVHGNTYLAHVWIAPTQEDNDDENVVGNDGDVCVLGYTKSDSQKMSLYGKCHLQCCMECIATHTYDNLTVLYVCNCVILCTQVDSDSMFTGQLNQKKDLCY